MRRRSRRVRFRESRPSSARPTVAARPSTSAVATLLFPTDGAIEPLRTSPARHAVVLDRIARARGHSTVEHEPGDAGYVAVSRLRGERVAADERRLVEFHGPASPACSGVMSSVSSWPYSGMPASSRSTSRAPSPHGVEARGAIGLEQRVPDAVAVIARQRTARSRPRRCSRCARRCRARRRSSPRAHV